MLQKDEDQAALTIEEIVTYVRRIVDELLFEDVYYVLRSYKAKNMYESSVHTVRYALALHIAGLPITSNVMLAVRPDLNVKTITLQLHNLGDKHILSLKRDPFRYGGEKTRHIIRKGTQYEWIVHPAFVNYCQYLISSAKNAVLAATEKNGD